jgi:hypothetical protein
MKHKTVSLLLISVLVVFTLAAGVLALTDPQIPRWTVDGGGGQSTGSGYTLTGSIGQHDTGAMSGGGYTLSGGFWGSKADPNQDSDFEVYLPLTIK